VRADTEESVGLRTEQNQDIFFSIRASSHVRFRLGYSRLKRGRMSRMVRVHLDHTSVKKRYTYLQNHTSDLFADISSIIFLDFEVLQAVN
jgi:hypothetical protein